MQIFTVTGIYTFIGHMCWESNSFCQTISTEFAFAILVNYKQFIKRFSVPITATANFKYVKWNCV